MDKIEQLFYTVQDSTDYNGLTVPAMTTLLYRVCDGDGTKFDEACRLIQLFMTAAFKEGKNEPT